MNFRTKRNFSMLACLGMSSLLSFSAISDTTDPGQELVIRFCKVDEDMAGTVYDAKQRGMGLSQIVEIFNNDPSYGEYRIYIPRFVYKYGGFSRQKIQDMVFESCLENEKVVKEIIEAKSRIID